MLLQSGVSGFPAESSQITTHSFLFDPICMFYKRDLVECRHLDQSDQATWDVYEISVRRLLLPHTGSIHDIIHGLAIILNSHGLGALI
jgi:hypothetical protein